MAFVRAGEMTSPSPAPARCGDVWRSWAWTPAIPRTRRLAGIRDALPARRSAQSPPESQGSGRRSALRRRRVRPRIRL